MNKICSFWSPFYFYSSTYFFISSFTSSSTTSFTSYLTSSSTTSFTSYFTSSSSWFEKSRSSIIGPKSSSSFSFSFNSFSLFYALSPLSSSKPFGLDSDLTILTYLSSLFSSFRLISCIFVKSSYSWVLLLLSFSEIFSPSSSFLIGYIFFCCSVFVFYSFGLEILTLKFRIKFR